MREKMLINLASIDSMQVKKDKTRKSLYMVHIATRGGEIIRIEHIAWKEKWDEDIDSRDVLLYEPAGWSKESLFSFVERELLGKYEIQWRTGKIKYAV